MWPLFRLTLWWPIPYGDLTALAGGQRTLLLVCWSRCFWERSASDLINKLSRGSQRRQRKHELAIFLSWDVQFLLPQMLVYLVLSLQIWSGSHSWLSWDSTTIKKANPRTLGPALEHKSISIFSLSVCLPVCLPNYYLSPIPSIFQENIFSLSSIQLLGRQAEESRCGWPEDRMPPWNSNLKVAWVTARLGD